MEYHLDKRTDLSADPASVQIEEAGPLRASLSVTTHISSESSIKQVISLDALSDQLVFDTQVDWHENRKFLKGTSLLFCDFVLDLFSLFYVNYDSGESQLLTTYFLLL